MPFPLSATVTNAIAPPIPRAQAWAAAYEGKDLLNLSQGVPGDAPHPLLVDKLIEVVKHGQGAGYGPILGEEGLRRAVKREMGWVYRWDGWEAMELDDDAGRLASGKRSFEEDVGEEGTIVSGRSSMNDAAAVPPAWNEIAITSGCNQAFFGVILALCGQGDKVLLPVPWYFNMLMTFQVLGVTPVPLPLDPAGGFTPCPAAARAILESPEGTDMKALVLVTPNNPTGCTYSPALIAQFADLAREKNVALIVDETYRDFIPPSIDASKTQVEARGQQQQRSGSGKPHDLFTREDWREHVISVGSFSKSYKIPGHRLGVIVAGRQVLKGITTVADCIQCLLKICAPRPPQIALAAVLPALRDDLAQTSARLAARLRLFKQLVENVPGWKVEAQGGFFSYVRHPFVRSTGLAAGAKEREWMPSEHVSKVLAERCGVLTLPGAFFMPARDDPTWDALSKAGSVLVDDRWIRFAVANVDDDLVRKVPERLERLNEIMVNDGYELAD
ncbi:hypothetical protein QFC19_008203 [Naganishia cerealis]|uniref:Uncharacterized protein n=1 Tax=Naganishia cerealis TaxID=610337 RepID=A0ACC2V455_9TREE|nr:hypothetical protein QFC19_008203 [Naganishia cerealis]